MPYGKLNPGALRWSFIESYAVKHTFFACIKFSRISWAGPNYEIKYLWNFRPVKY